MHESWLRVTSCASKKLGWNRESDHISIDYLKSSLFFKKACSWAVNSFPFPSCSTLPFCHTKCRSIWICFRTKQTLFFLHLIFPLIFSVVFVYPPLGQYPVSKRFQERHWGLSKGRTLISTLLLELVKWQESPSLDPITSWFLWWWWMLVKVKWPHDSSWTV